MQLGRYPRILPAEPIIQAEQSSTSDNFEGTGKESKKRQSSQPRPGACAGCCARKTKCDGIRPACRSCSRRGIIRCTYPERLVNGRKAIELVDLLRSLSEERSTALLQRLREGVDLAAVLAEYRDDGDKSNPPSKSTLLEPTNNKDSLESELKAHYPISFPSLPPINPSILAKSDLLRPQPSLSSAIRLNGRDIVIPNAPSELSQLPEKSANYYNEKLKYLQADFWTHIRISNDFTARVISLYLETDHPLLGLFNPYLFIDDLVSKRTNYCSKFLFHALMFLGCQMYSAFDESAIQYANDFYQIAESLWKTEKDSYSSMAGAILLSTSLLGHGKDYAVLSYAIDAMNIGTRLGLFGDSQPPASAHISGADMVENDLSAQCYAAWGVFNWNMTISMLYRQPGAQVPVSIPTVPIPGEMSDIRRPNRVGAEMAAEMKYEGKGEDEKGNPLEDMTRRAFPVLCNFWRIVYKYRWTRYVVHESPPYYLRNTLVESAYRELIAWAERAPPFLFRREQCTHYALVFHIWLHTAILDMWQPFVHDEENRAPQLSTFTAPDCTPDAAYAASLQQLKQLIVEYRSRHAASTYSMLWYNGLIYLLHAMLRCTDPNWRLYLLLCIYGYERLRRPYRIAEVVTQGLLTVTMSDTNTSWEEACKIMEELKGRGLVDVRDDLENKIRATFMSDLSLELTEAEAVSAENLASDMNMAEFQDLVALDPDINFMGA
ncbi:hypothetical protein F4679DRAFT_597404 [Xylaria curta]|nr:hypothetical protein F4679DRAFT_597404 [Xylaria curta]